MKNEKIDVFIVLCLVMAFVVISIDSLYYTGILYYSNAFFANFVVKILTALENKNLFSNPYNLKIGSLILLMLASLLTRVKKSVELNSKVAFSLFTLGLLMLGANSSFVLFNVNKTFVLEIVYILFNLLGLIFFAAGFNLIRRILGGNFGKDRFNSKNELFDQTKEKIENEYSVNLKTLHGWVNIINPFRATMVLGTPGSGKSYAVVEPFMEQHIEKGFSMLVYDFKFPTLSEIAYNYLKRYSDNYKIAPKFYAINLDDPEYSHRCNPLGDKHISTKDDAQEAAETIFINMNKEILKKKDFFSTSAIALTAAVIYYFKLIKQPKLFTLPHVIEFIMRPDNVIFPILKEYEELRPILVPFVDALEKEAFDQLAGQTASARVELQKLSSKEIYWALSGDEIDLRINSKEAPAILCVGNNIERQKTYAAPLGLIISTMVKMINKQGRNPTSLIIDELPTIYINGLDNLIATARSNKVSTLMAFQDLSQLRRDYGKEVADVIYNTSGNVISGSVKAETAKSLQEMFGKIKMKKESISINKESTSISISEQMDYLIPQDKITKLSQGEFVGMLADNFDQRLEQKVFRSEIVVDKSTLGKKKIPKIRKFPPGEKDLILNQNYSKIVSEVDELIKQELNQ